MGQRLAVAHTSVIWRRHLDPLGKFLEKAKYHSVPSLWGNRFVSIVIVPPCRSGNKGLALECIDVEFPMVAPLGPVVAMNPEESDTRGNIPSKPKGNEMSKAASRRIGPPSTADRPPSMTIYLNRVHDMTKTDMRRLREYRLHPDTPIHRVVQCDREKGTLFGDITPHSEHSELFDLVRDVVEGRPPESYSPTQSIQDTPTPIFLRTRGKLKRIEKKKWKRPLTCEELHNKMVVINPNAPIGDDAIDLVAKLLLDAVERRQKGTSVQDGRTD